MNSFYARRLFSLTIAAFFSGFLFAQTTEHRAEITKNCDKEELVRLE